MSEYKGLYANRDFMAELRKTMEVFERHTTYYDMYDKVEKPAKPTEVIMSLPEDCERHILGFSGHNQEYETSYLNWIFETLYQTTNRYSNFIMNVKKHFKYYDTPAPLLKWKGEPRDLIKAELKKQIDELTAIYDEI